ncbi:MAG: hypothetical protein ACT4QF_11830 [Sporichthyaceae bacterium]
MRLFVALPLPERVRAEVAEWVADVAGLADGVRWAASEQWRGHGGAAAHESLARCPLV